MFAVSFAEVEEEFISHVITVLNFLLELGSDFILNSFIFPKNTIHKLDHIVNQRLKEVHNKIRSSDLILDETLAERFIIIDFVL